MSFGTGPFGKSINVAAQVVNGLCPTCDHEGVFVSINPHFFRCITCGSDVEQKINGQIKYMKTFPPSSDVKMELNTN
jgi:uncharacterized protein (DUF983 family)